MSRNWIKSVTKIIVCKLLTSNHMIFLVQFWNKWALVTFSKTTNCTRPTGSGNFVSLWKIYSCSFIPNCTRNHVITGTNCLRLSGTKFRFLFLDALNHATLKWDNLSHSMTGTLMAQKNKKQQCWSQKCSGFNTQWLCINLQSRISF